MTIVVLNLVAKNMLSVCEKESILVILIHSLLPSSCSITMRLPLEPFE